jgi:glycosyltransferase involved in cell wall biosynthesis
MHPLVAKNVQQERSGSKIVRKPRDFKVDVAVIVLTFNEEANLQRTLDSVGWAKKIFVVDSFSTDRTLEIARLSGAIVYQHPFEHFATQRNWALDNLPIEAEWVLFLDADEQVTQELEDEITSKIETIHSRVSGFYINRRFIFLGRSLKHGGYSNNWVLRLVRHREATVLKGGIWEYVNVTGTTEYLKAPMLHEDRKGLKYWIDKHNQYSSAEARSSDKFEIVADVGEVEGRRRLWVKRYVYNRLPPIGKAALSFLYRYVLRLGFLDGKTGFVYYFLHDLWYPLLVAAKKDEDDDD